MSENYTVYMHRFPNGKVYIGITKQTVEERWRNGVGINHVYISRACHSESGKLCGYVWEFA